VGISKEGKNGNVRKPIGEEAVEKAILGKFTPAEKMILKKIAKHCAKALECLVQEGREKAMSQYNTL
jgi:peptidyl-tRNA hydrolase